MQLPKFSQASVEAIEKYEKPTEDTEDCLDAILDILHNCEPSEVGTGLYNSADLLCPSNCHKQISEKLKTYFLPSNDFYGIKRHRFDVTFYSFLIIG